MERKQVKLGAYNLNVISTTNFKTVRIEVKFKREIIKEEIDIRNLLKSILISSSKKYFNDRQIIIKTEELYDLKLSSINRRIGNMSVMSFNVTFLNEKFTEPGMMKESLDFLMEILFNPNIENNAFLSDSFDICKNDLIKTISSKKDNKTKYSIYELLKSMGDYPYSYDLYGSIERLQSITPSELYNYYLSVIKNDLVDVYVVGDVDVDKIVNYFKNNFKVCTFKKEKNNVLLQEVENAKRIKTREIIDNVQQTKLSIGCRLNKLSDYERKYILHVYNEILGGSGNSLLFDAVREKKSLAYYISSFAQPYDNLLIIYSGIDDNNITVAMKTIKKIMKDLQTGKIKDSSFSNAIKSILSSLDTVFDTQTGIINNFFAIDLLGSDNLEKRRELFSQVEKKDVISFANKVKIDTVFKLKGEDNAKFSDK